MVFKRNVLVFIFFLICKVVNSQINNIGTPEIVNYTSRDYSYITQIISITQDSLGLMYFATTDGYLLYDGNNWEHNYSNNGSVVRSIYTSNRGSVFIGAYNNFGYLENDFTGKLTYVSLIERLKKEDQNFGDIWRINEAENKIFFQSFSHIFVLDDTVLNVFKPEKRFEFSFVVDGKFYVLDKSRGMLLFLNNEFIEIPDGKKFISLSVWQLLPLDKNNLLVVTESNGLMIYDGRTLKPWNIHVNGELKKYRAISATKVFEKYFVLGTLQNGIYIIDSIGNLVQHIDKKKGLASNSAISLFIDKFNNLWVGNENGLDYVSIASPVKWIDHRNEVQGIVYSVITFSDKLYIATNSGVYYSNWNRGNGINDFYILDDTKGTTWNLSEANNILLCGHNLGTYIINKHSVNKISDVNGGWIFFSDNDFPGYLFEGTYEGILVYQTSNGTIKYRNKIAGFNESSRIVLRDNDGYYWILHPYKGAYRIKLNYNLTGLSEFNFYKIGQDCPANIYGYKLNNEIIFTSPSGIYNFNKSTLKFVKNEYLTKLFGVEGQVFAINQDKLGNVWYIIDKKLKRLRYENAQYKPNTEPFFNKMNGLFQNGFEYIYINDTNNVFVATTKGVAHFSQVQKFSNPDGFNSVIRKVESAYSDSVFYYGFGLPQTNVLAYTQNSINIKYSASYYEMPEQLLYKYRLIGLDTIWSNWTRITEKQYNNLPEGNYCFEVVAKNYLDNQSVPAKYYFAILPPWYRTIYAYLAYFIAAIFLIYVIIQYIRHKFEKQKIQYELEKLSEIKQKQEEHRVALLNAEMEKKKAELAAVAMQISVKNDALLKVIDSLQAIAPQINSEAKKHIEELISSIQSNIHLDDEWDRFLDYFDEVHKDFISKLKNKYPDFTITDLKLCAYLRMQLSSKEIAVLMSISLRGVEKARYRLRKKMQLDTDEDLSEFIISITS